jgi:osmotically-inducible protein OsmY
MTDKTIRQDVMEELEFEPSVNADHIGVTVENGVVTLSGHVTSYAQKLAAEKATRRVRGVRAIAQEIEVRFPEDKKTDDDEIAQRALNILKWNAVVPQGAVRVKVQNGWVGLSGEVSWNYQRIAAESVIRRLSGVVGVVNSITVKPQVQAADVKRKIEQALQRNAQIEAAHIMVTASGGRVTLDGKVHDWQEHQMVENAAWSAPGVTIVEDRLMVG